jgi:hypothetical protein
MEVWKKIEGFENYEISTFGNVRGLPIITKFGIATKKYPLRFIKKWNDKKGYLYVTLINNGKKKNLLIHRLVCSAFLENKHCKAQVNHKNGIKSDNNIENLEWCTAKENLKHAVDTGLNINYGIYNYQSKLNLQDIDFIRNSDLKQRELSLKYNISQTTISKIILRKTYKKC